MTRLKCQIKPKTPMTKIQRTKWFCHLSTLISPYFFKIPPLKIRGAGGVMKIIEITPFIPLTLRGRFKEGGSFSI